MYRISGQKNLKAKCSGYRRYRHWRLISLHNFDENLQSSPYVKYRHVFYIPYYKIQYVRCIHACYPSAGIPLTGYPQ